MLGTVTKDIPWGSVFRVTMIQTTFLDDLLISEGLRVVNIDCHLVGLND